MGTINQICTICGAQFAPQFSYQMEERIDADSTGRPRARFAYYCSQQCLERSHQGGDSGSVACDACAASFQVELASQVVFVDGRRHYACSPDCRAQVLREARGSRLGDSAPVVPLRPEAPAEPPDASGDSSAPSSARTATPAGKAQVLAVFNHKGGTGKTTTAVTIAAGLASQGQRVLLVDTDGQGNVAVSLGLKSERSLYHVLVMGLAFADAVTSPRPNLDVLPANETLAAAELYLAGRHHRDRVLATRLSAARESYDFVVVDCSPSLSLMNQNALCFADSVLCPVACDYLSLVGVRQVLRTVKQVNKLLGHPVKLWGLLPTMYDARARICNEALETMREHFKDRCLTPIRSTIRVKEAPSQGLTLLEHAPDSNAAEDYLAVVKRLLDERIQAPRPLVHSAVGGVR
jgi:chromosome partitioning protein